MMIPANDLDLIVTRSTSERVNAAIVLGTSGDNRGTRMVALQVQAGPEKHMRYVQLWLRHIGPRGGGQHEAGVLLGQADIDMRVPVFVPGWLGGTVE